MLSALSLLLPEIEIIFAAFFATLICVFIQNNKVRWYVALAILAIAAFSAITLLYNISGIEAKIFNDSLEVKNIWSLAKVGVVGMVIVSLAMYATSFNPDNSNFELPILLMFSAFGIMILISAANYLTLYLAIEVMSLPLYVLVASKRNEEYSSEAGIKYFILGALSSAIILFGISIHYAATSTIEFYGANVVAGGESDYSGRESLLIMLAQAFILVAIFFKLSAAPFHMWAPDVYEGSPTIVAGFISTASKVAAVIVLLKLLLAWEQVERGQWHDVIALCAILSLVVGSFAGLWQKNIQRLLAYSSISHIGFILLGFLSINNESISGVFIYVFIYVIMVIATFFIIYYLKIAGIANTEISSLAGLSSKHPVIAFALAVLMFSLAGVPPMAGFFAKLYILIPIIHEGQYWMALIAVICSVVSIFYYLKIVKVMYFDSLNGVDKNPVITKEQSYRFLMVVFVGLAIAFNLLFFITPESYINYISSIVVSAGLER